MITDRDDKRADEEIAPRVTPVGSVHVHVFRCTMCCAKAPCPGGVVEGWLARAKVRTLFSMMYERFGASKDIFFKLDPDAIATPHHLRSLLSEAVSLLGTSQPYMIGLAACRSTGPLSRLCHPAGGAGYGLSLGAAAALRAFHTRLHVGGSEAKEAGAVDESSSQYHELLRKSTYGGEDVSVALALSREVGATVVSCGSLYQMRPDMYAFQPAHQTDGVRWPLSPTPVSFHTFKHAEWVRNFFGCALYATDGSPRCFLPDAAALLQGHCPSGLPSLSSAECAEASARVRVPTKPPADGQLQAEEVSACEANCTACIPTYLPTCIPTYRT